MTHTFRIGVGYNDPEAKIFEGLAIYHIEAHTEHEAQDEALSLHARLTPSQEQWIESTEEL